MPAISPAALPNPAQLLLATDAPVPATGEAGFEAQFSALLTSLTMPARPAGKPAQAAIDGKASPEQKPASGKQPGNADGKLLPDADTAADPASDEAALADLAPVGLAVLPVAAGPMVEPAPVALIASTPPAANPLPAAQAARQAERLPARPASAPAPSPAPSAALPLAATQAPQVRAMASTAPATATTSLPAALGIVATGAALPPPQAAIAPSQEAIAPSQEAMATTQTATTPGSPPQQTAAPVAPLVIRLPITLRAAPAPQTRLPGAAEPQTIALLPEAGASEPSPKPAIAAQLARFAVDAPIVARVMRGAAQPAQSEADRAATAAAASGPAPASNTLPSAADQPLPASAASSPIPQPLAAAPAAPVTVQPGVAPATAAAQPIDFAKLIDRLVEARQSVQATLGGQTVDASIQHAEFGRVALQFRQDADGMTVSFSNPDPDLARAVQSLAASAPAPAAQSDSAATPQRQDSQQGTAAFAQNQSGGQPQQGQSQLGQSASAQQRGQQPQRGPDGSAAGARNDSETQTSSATRNGIFA